MPNTDTMTPTEALEYLAGLERVCRDCTAKDGIPCHCYRAPLLDLREPCPCPRYCCTYSDSDEGEGVLCSKCRENASAGTARLANRMLVGRLLGLHGDWCENCHGRNWIAKQEIEALHQAMNKAGWAYDIHQTSTRVVRFWNYFRKPGVALIEVLDANDWLAAAKAMEMTQC